MAKALFRFLRGELNGYWITNIHNSLNEYSKDIKKFLIDWQNQQFALGQIPDETLYNLGKFASVFLPRRPVADSRSSLYMTDSHIVDGVEFSERGLFNTDTENFTFEHTDPSITSPDINTLATNKKRSSLVGDEEPIGFISQDETDVINDNAEVRPEKILAEPPQGKAYSEFYGNQFLFLSEGDTVYETISSVLFIELFKALQWIRYNGASLASLVKVISVICPEGLVKIDRTVVSADGKAIYVYYVYDSTSTATDKESRLALLEYIIDLKFKQTVLVEVQ